MCGAGGGGGGGDQEGGGGGGGGGGLQTVGRPFIGRWRSSHPGTAETNPTENHEVAGSNPGLAPWVRDPAWPRAVV